MSFEIDKNKLNENQKLQLANNLDIAQIFSGAGEINAKIRNNLFREPNPSEYTKNSVAEYISNKLMFVARTVDPTGEKFSTDDSNAFDEMLHSAANDKEDTECILNGLKVTEKIRDILNEYNQRTNFKDAADPLHQALNVVVRNMESQVNQLVISQQRNETNELTNTADRIDAEINNFIRDKETHVNHCNQEKIPAFFDAEGEKKLDDLFQAQKSVAVPIKKRIDDIDDAINKMNLTPEDLTKVNKVSALENNLNDIKGFAKNCVLLNQAIANGSARANLIKNKVTEQENGLMEKMPDKTTAHFLSGVLKPFKAAKNDEQFQKAWENLTNVLNEQKLSLGDDLSKKVSKYNQLNDAKKELSDTWKKMGEACNNIKENRRTMRENLINKKPAIQQELDGANKLKGNIEKSLDISDNMASFIKKAQDLQKALKECTRIGHTNTREFTLMANALDEFVKEPTNMDKAHEMMAKANAYQAEKQKHKSIFSSNMREHRLVCAADIASLGKDCFSLLENVNNVQNGLNDADKKIDTEKFNQRSDSADGKQKVSVDDYIDLFNDRMNSMKENAMHQTDSVKSVIHPEPVRQKSEAQVIG